MTKQTTIVVTGALRINTHTALTEMRYKAVCSLIHCSYIPGDQVVLQWFQKELTLTRMQTVNDRIYPKYSDRLVWAEKRVVWPWSTLFVTQSSSF